jgi:3' terminal RNA ribose 2'-O-methyltransferase Hen1
VLLSLSTTHRPATDLGFLLHKHPDRAQAFKLPFGTAHVLYPEASEERCTATLLLEIDPLALTRRGRGGFALAEYVNDRPYAASSLMSVALVTVFKSAIEGRTPELARTAIPLEASLPAVPARGGEELVHKLFAPLGYEVRTRDIGSARHVALELRATTRLAQLLTHLYVLLPVLDDAKHYWVAPDEIDKLLRSGAGWLGGHPEKVLITRRYLAHRRSLAATALDLLDHADPDTVDAPADTSTDEDAELPVTRKLSLAEQRRDAVVAALHEVEASRVLDLGCGGGALLAALLKDRRFSRIVGADVSSRALEQAARRLRLDRLPERQRDRITLWQSALTYRDDRLRGFDAAVLMEVVEHVDPPRLPALEASVFGHARPGAVVVTTPNAEYNVRYEGLTGMRHSDHRFEWTRAEFAEWAARVAAAHGYRVGLRGVGDPDPALGAPTQLALFVREERA